ncbi:transposase [Leptothoe sp. PORK10 BA2]|uniref:transposase n=1 Tax=Leptothoe sp. PORK10 BA2 TaxID=3110254 RepID=UPI003FA3D93C
MLSDVLPKKKWARPLEWSYRELIDGRLYPCKNGFNGEDLPKDLPPSSTVYGHYNHWRKAGTIEKRMNRLHGQGGLD